MTTVRSSWTKRNISRPLLSGMFPKILSGGQTGADQAALDWAIGHQLTHGGWCPKGRKSEKGPIDFKYALYETPSEDYLQRTEWNARDSDGTVVFSLAPILSGGSKRTVDFAIELQKPWLHIHPGVQDPGTTILRFVTEHNIRSLNIAGARESEEPEVGGYVGRSLEAAFYPREELSDLWMGLRDVTTA